MFPNWFTHKRLSKLKNWKIKKYTANNGSEYYRCFYRIFLIWEAEYTQSGVYTYDSLVGAKKNIADSIVRNVRMYGKETEKTETIKFR